MTENKSLFTRFRSHPTIRAGTTYAFVAFITVQVLSLISTPLNLNESVLQGAIWISIVGFPVVVFLSYIISSHFSTLKLLGLTVGVLAAVYLGGSFYWIQYIKNPELQDHK